MRNVTVIPASVNKFSSIPLATKEKRKVAAYARVSTDEEEQQTSYAAQCDYYERYIKSRSDWEFVKVYADEGISGCNTKKRIGFNTMVEDALAGKIQLILTNIKTPYLIQFQTRVQTSEVLATRASEVFCCLTSLHFVGSSVRQRSPSESAQVQKGASEIC